MERFDILDINGERTGRTALKGTALRTGEYYLGVHVYVYRTPDIFLLQQRALDKKFLPGGWDIHMGHVIAGESSSQAAVREIQEELGVDVRMANFRHAHRFLWEEYHHMVDIYFLKLDKMISELHLQASEVIDVKFVSRSEMIELVTKMYYRPQEYRYMVLEEIEKLGSTQSVFTN